MNFSDRHLRFGWWSLFSFLALGVVLETLHGFKIGWYLDVSNEMRRLMFTLAHAHGTLFAVVNIAVALTLRTVAGINFTRAASLSLLWGSVLLPIGFLLGGVTVHEGDPGLGVVLVPIGALLLLFGVGSFAHAVSQAGRATAKPVKR
ncbi:hypothetical protein K0B96_05230 [Horticoccus luteus]|uniref:Uncharacterized protein n=1 Tax=Horticoccus luteus TaxID=2862869 RepID=A0A8F9TXF1_9BACT|nr:hypothetical protein [Horticoccus luteus]QYM80023.1 hypothetical protein K0B96_05230 [Horticoccus luteus]